MKQEKGKAYHPLVDEAAGAHSYEGTCIGLLCFKLDDSTHPPTSFSPRRSPPQAVTFPHQGPLEGGAQALRRHDENRWGGYGN